jgi:protein SCO1/2
MNRRLFATAGIVAAALVIALVARAMRPKPELPVMGQLPTFALVDQKGATFTHADLAGHVFVIDFIFTHCTSTCPRLTARMKELEAQVGNKAKLVSISVDPETDTPPVLSEYARKNDARWIFLTGSADAIKETVVTGFKMAMQRTSPEEVLHGNWFVLGDRAGKIRGYYDVADGVGAVKADVERLFEEKR